MDRAPIDKITHDLKTPLTALRTQVQLLARMEKNGKLDQAFLKKMLEAMERETLRMNELCEELGHQLERIIGRDIAPQLDA